MTNESLQKLRNRFGNAWVIFSDGAASGNPGPGGWAAIVLSPDGAVEEISGASPHTTNNKMEIGAAYEGLKSVANYSSKAEVWVLTDSNYLIQGATAWKWGWIKNGWKTQAGGDVANRELWEALFQVLRQFSKVNWGYVPGHSNNPGNDRVDEMAVSRTRGVEPAHFRGQYLSYSVDLSELPQSLAPPQPKRDSEKPKKPLYYMSLVSNEVQRHPTWSECEARVKGRPGAKFQKVHSDSEAQALLAKWGFSEK